MHPKTLLLLLAAGTAALATAVPPPTSGTTDAPVDGLDGKPHSGPGLYPEHADKKGTGEVGVSGGGSSVDIRKPPPHTGEHEIVDIEDLGEGDESSQLSLKKGKKKGGDEDEDDDDDEQSAPVSSSGHKEYQSQTDTLADPPAAAQPHLSPIDDDDDNVPGGISQPFHSFTLSFVMIIFSEIGDKTFLIAALMAMKHPRLLVFSAALSSLIVMSILSALLGHAVPTLLPKNFTNFLAAGLFLVFGVRMVLEGLRMEKGTANVQEEMKEVEQELEEKASHGMTPRGLEGGLIASPRGPHIRRSTSSPSLSDSDEDDYARARGRGGSGGKAQNTRVTSLEGIQNLAGLLLSPAWVQTFVMTFLGEWGDRSQIATIAMAAGQDYWYVTVGAISGHAICTGIAVVGGRMLASRISVRNVTLGGAAAFLAFGVIYLAEALWYGSS